MNLLQDDAKANQQKLCVGKVFSFFSVKLICHLQMPSVLLNWISFLRLSDYDMNYTLKFVHHSNEF